MTGILVSSRESYLGTRKMADNFLGIRRTRTMELLLMLIFVCFTQAANVPLPKGKFNPRFANKNKP